MTLYVIKSSTERGDEDEPLYWSNHIGWVDLESATRFSDEERKAFRLLPLSGEWVEDDSPPSDSHPCPCPSCGGTDISFHEYILRRYPAGKVEDGKLIFPAKDAEMVWHDYRDGCLVCNTCGLNYPDLNKKIDFK